MDDDFHANLEALVTKRKAFLLAQREPVEELFRQNEEMFLFLYNFINDSVFELKAMICKSADNVELPQTEPTYSQFQSAPNSPATTPRKVLVPETPPAKVGRAGAPPSASKNVTPQRAKPEVTLDVTVANKESKLSGMHEVTKPPVQPKRKSARKKPKVRAEENAEDSETKRRSEHPILSDDEIFFSDNEQAEKAPLDEPEPEDDLPVSQSSGDMMTQPPVALDTSRAVEFTSAQPAEEPLNVTPSNAPTNASSKAASTRTLPPQRRLETTPLKAPTVPSVLVVAKPEPVLDVPEPPSMEIEKNRKNNDESSRHNARDIDRSSSKRKTSPKTSDITQTKDPAPAPVSLSDATQPPPRTSTEPPQTPHDVVKKRPSDDDNTSPKSGSRNGLSSRYTFGSSNSSKLRKRRKRKRPRVSLEELEPEPILETCRDDDDEDFVQESRARKTPSKLPTPSSSNPNKSPRKTVQTAVKFKTTGPSPTGLRFEGFRTPEAVDRAVRRQAAARRRMEEDIAAKETVLGHARKALPGYDCRECAEMFDYEAGGDPVRKQQLLRHCKHKAKKSPPQTPDDYWKLTFDETQTQAPATLRQPADEK